MTLTIEIFKTCWWVLALILLQAYLFGSINFAIIITRAYAHADIRSFGSGNAGATNVLRTQGACPALITTLGDMAKSIAAVSIGGLILSSAVVAYFPGSAADFSNVQLIGQYIAGFGCILGHLYPIFFEFRGGKGVASTFGVMIILDWHVALICFAAFLLTVLVSKMVSLGSVIAAALFPVLTFLFRHFIYGELGYIVFLCTFMSALLSGLVIIKHRTNIKRIANGTESRISFKK